MKKIIALALSFAVWASVSLCGCDAANKEETDVTGWPFPTQETDDDTDDEPVYYSDIDMVKFKLIQSLYNRKCPYGKYGVSVFDDSINGAGNYYVSEDNINFNYTSLDGNSILILDVTPSTSTVRVTFALRYGEKVYSGYNRYDLNVGMIQTFIDDIIVNNKDSVAISDETGFADNQDKIKADMPIVYSRLIVLADKAFAELGMGMEDMGVGFGHKYRYVNPAEFLSQETEVRNEHKFVNGVCEDCGMLWIDYYYEALGKIGFAYDGGGYFANGQPSDLMDGPGDNVSIVSKSKGTGEIRYDHVISANKGNGNPHWFNESCEIVMKQNQKKMSSYIQFKYDESTVNPDFTYYLKVEAKDGDYSKIFESKESLMKNADLALFVKGTDVWGIKSEEEIRKMLSDNEYFEYYTREEFVEMIWNDYSKMLDCMDKGMKWMDTSLSDAGIKWKKNQ